MPPASLAWRRRKNSETTLCLLLDWPGGGVKTDEYFAEKSVVEEILQYVLDVYRRRVL